MDLLFDGQGLYAKSPIAATLLPMLMAQSGTPLTGDLSGWIKLGTKDEFAALAGSLGGALPIPSPAADPANELASLDPAWLKQKLDEAGDHDDVRRHRAAQRRQRGRSRRLPSTRRSSPPVSCAKEVPADRLKWFTNVANDGTMSADLWIDKIETSASRSSTSTSPTRPYQKADVTVLVGHAQRERVRDPGRRHRGATRTAPPAAGPAPRRGPPRWAADRSLSSPTETTTGPGHTARGSLNSCFSLVSGLQPTGPPPP